MSKLEEYGFDTEEVAEEALNVKLATGYPKPILRRRIVYESFNQNIEEIYYWLIDFMRIDNSCTTMEKITDVFAASEQSSFFGAAQARLGIQQDKVSQFLATIGKMIKELFQLVRELRILDERVRIYKDSYRDAKKKEGAEITLKGIWIDMVEMGGKNPSSVYGMATELQFTSLPDLFYSIHPDKVDDVEDEVEKKAQGFNRKVKEVLKRKLKTFMIWKEATYKEMNAKRTFTLKYLRQHYDIIRMYMAWVKPYLRNVRRVQMADKTKEVDMIAAFEGSIVEIELVGMKRDPKKTFHPTTMLTIYFRSKPALDYHQEGYQHRGPLHIGRARIDMRAYSWTDLHLTNYKKYREDEEMDMIKTIDSSVRAAYDALGDDLQRYLEEAGEKFDKPLLTPEGKEKPKQDSIIEPFISIFRGFGDIASSLTGREAGVKAGKQKKKSRQEMYLLAIEKDDAATTVRKDMWKMYDKFKKSHKMLAW
ncbi:MAG: hypothetical protein Q8O89_02715 [Nanoarchaeota archaeon]|nr:hypothetical protein [Nanoarchaeota archaeon]